MRTNRELLELAARAFGRWGDKSKYIENVYDYDSLHHGSAAIQWDEYCYDTWNPLKEDGDCARMEAKLGIDIEWWEAGVVACAKFSIPHADERASEEFAHHPDRNAARRMASVRVAAEIGASIP